MVSVERIPNVFGALLGQADALLGWGLGVGGFVV